jgi:RNA polymerase sigma-70 factor (ECF subfamily)
VELIKKAKANDRVAQLMLYKKYSSRILAVARYYIRDLQYAEDVMITAFYKAFTRIQQFKKEVNFEGWLRVVKFFKKSTLTTSTMESVATFTSNT